MPDADLKQCGGMESSLIDTGQARQDLLSFVDRALTRWPGLADWASFDLWTDDKHNTVHGGDGPDFLSIMMYDTTAGTRCARNDDNYEGVLWAKRKTESGEYEFATPWQGGNGNSPATFM